MRTAPHPSPFPAEVSSLALLARSTAHVLMTLAGCFFVLTQKVNPRAQGFPLLPEQSPRAGGADKHSLRGWRPGLPLAQSKSQGHRWTGWSGPKGTSLLRSTPRPLSPTSVSDHLPSGLQKTPQGHLQTTPAHPLPGPQPGRSFKTRICPGSPSPNPVMGSCHTKNEIKTSTPHPADPDRPSRPAPRPCPTFTAPPHLWGPWCCLSPAWTARMVQPRRAQQLSNV